MTQIDKRPSLKAPANDEGSANAQSGAQGASTDAVQYTLVLHQVHRAIGEKRLTDAERAFYERSISKDAAKTAGRRVGPADACAEFARCANAYHASASAGELTGYGPLRMRYGVALALSIAAQLPEHDALTSGVSEASARAEVTLELTAPARRKATRALRTVLSGDDVALARLRTASEGGRMKSGRSRAFALLAAEVKYAREHVVASVLNDAGLTPAVLDALVASSQTVAEARAARTTKRNAKQALRGALAEPTGRLVHEMRLMLAGARDARKTDPTLPDVTSYLVSHRAPAAKPPDHA